MTKQGRCHWTHKGWTVRLQIRPDGWLYCCWPPDLDPNGGFLFAADTLKEAKSNIEAFTTADDREGRRVRPVRQGQGG